MLLNKIWVAQSQITNYFCGQQQLVSKVRDGAKVTKKYDTATTPHRRAERHDAVTAHDKAILVEVFANHPEHQPEPVRDPRGQDAASHAAERAARMGGEPVASRGPRTPGRLTLG